MKSSLYYIISFITGAVISIMVTFNTEAGRITSSEVSLIVNQIVGIITLEAIMLLARKNEVVNPPRKAVKWTRHYFGGLFGVAIISLNYISVTGAGATIAMAGAVFGQSLSGLIFDLTGALGIKKESIKGKRIVSLIICTMIQMVYNSSLAKAKGAFYSARMNVISGLFGALVYSFLFFSESTVQGFKALASASFLTMIMGGLLACIVVVNTNIVIPKIPAVYSALLLSSGQILTALLIDYILYDTFTPSLLYGTLVTIAGILLSMEKKANR